MTVVIRSAAQTDVPLIRSLIEKLAEYEGLAHECTATDELLAEALFSDRPYAEVVIAEVDETAAGFALFFHNFSTFLSKPGIYLEDLFVIETFRGKGVGKALLAHLAALAVELGCGRLEWSVLDWNSDAIGFYRSIGATSQDEWTVFRLTGDKLNELASARSSYSEPRAVRPPVLAQTRNQVER